jgi:hypothetical protein
MVLSFFTAIVSVTVLLVSFLRHRGKNLILLVIKYTCFWIRSPSSDQKMQRVNKNIGEEERECEREKLDLTRKF